MTIHYLASFIGGLLLATLMTLFVVPAVFSIFSGHLKSKRERDEEITSVASQHA